MKIYISGRVSDLDFDQAKANFLQAQELLQCLGIQAVNPLNNGLPAHSPWIVHMCKGIEMLHDCDAIYMMDGWTESSEACIEYDFACRTGKTILFASNVIHNQGIVLKIQSAIHEVTGLQLHQYNTKSRKRDGFFARMLFAHHCRQEKMKLGDIAEYIRRDLSSMTHLLNKYNDEVKYNHFFRSLAERVNNILQTSHQAH